VYVTNRNCDRLEAKIPKNMASLERDLSILEPWFQENVADGEKWMLRTPMPGAADINLYFMFKWGRDIARGVGVNNLTGGELPEMALEGIEGLFNERRFPGIWRWYENVEEYWAGLPEVEEREIEDGDGDGAREVLMKLNSAGRAGDEIPMLPTPQPWNKALDAKSGLVVGQEVSVAPDDTGRDDLVRGILMGLSAEEIVIKPADLGEGQKAFVEGVRIHFPRVGFVFRPLGRMNKL
jgi:hypothetical protein